MHAVQGARVTGKYKAIAGVNTDCDECEAHIYTQTHTHHAQHHAASAGVSTAV
jgi:hypothetical protein